MRVSLIHKVYYVCICSMCWSCCKFACLSLDSPAFICRWIHSLMCLVPIFSYKFFFCICIIVVKQTIFSTFRNEAASKYNLDPHWNVQNNSNTITASKYSLRNNWIRLEVDDVIKWHKFRHSSTKYDKDSWHEKVNIRKVKYAKYVSLIFRTGKIFAEQWKMSYM